MLENFCVCILHLFVCCPEVERDQELLLFVSIFMYMHAYVAVSLL